MSDPRVEVVESGAGIYSVGEQALAWGGAYRDTDLLWVPHFNVPLLYRGKMAVTLHDIAPLVMPEILSSAVKRRYAKLLIERAASRAAALFCVSEFTRSEVIARVSGDSRKITVTRPGLDADWPQTSVPHVEADGVPYVLYVGNVKPNKNLGLLLRAYRQIAAEVPYRLLLAGKMRGFGTGDDAVLREAEEMGERVRFAGEVPDAELQRMYAGAQALVLPSLYEGFGLPVLEAMQLGCPVLLSTAGSLPEVGGDAALYFDPRSVEELAGCLLQVRDRAKMEELRQKGRLRVQEFSFARCAEETAAVLNRLMEGN